MVSSTWALVEETGTAQGRVLGGLLVLVHQGLDALSEGHGRLVSLDLLWRTVAVVFTILLFWFYDLKQNHSQANKQTNIRLLSRSRRVALSEVKV